MYVSSSSHSGVRVDPKQARDVPTKDKADRATLDQVLDPRTRLILAGLSNRSVIGPIGQCISAGKEVRTATSAVPSDASGKCVYRRSTTQEIIRFKE